MRDYLLDMVKHTLPLAAFAQLRIDSNADATEISATEGEKQMVLRAKTHSPIPQFASTFGIPNLALLNTLLNIPEYDASAAITLMSKQHEGTAIPFNISFKNAAGDFQNDFRLMSAKVIESMEPKLNFNVKSWPVEFVPTANALQRLKYQVSALPDEKTVEFRVKDGKITASVGDASSHTGSFVFQDGVSATANHTIPVPSNFVVGALNMVGDKTIRMGDLGVMITVDSGLVSYDYIIPMVTK